MLILSPLIGMLSCRPTTLRTETYTVTPDRSTRTSADGDTGHDGVSGSEPRTLPGQGTQPGAPAASTMPVMPTVSAQRRGTAPRDRDWRNRLRLRSEKLLRILRFAAARASEERVPQVAASLAFTTILSMVPMLAVAFALFTAFPIFGEFRHALDEFMVSSLMPDVVANTVMEYINQLALQASRVSTFSAIFLLVTAISLIVTIDKALNEIWHVTRQRPVTQRILVYWAVLSLGPMMLGASLWTASYLARESLGLVGDLPPFIAFALSCLPLLVTGLGISAIFLVVPNQHVDWKDALLGGFGTAIVLELMKNGLAWYVTRFQMHTIVYGAFSILFLFLLWVYLAWLVILFGASITASLPMIRLGRHTVTRSAGAEFLDALVILRRLMLRQGATPPGIPTHILRARLHLHYNELMRVLEALTELGYVARIGDGSKERWALVCDPHTATLAPVFDRLLLDRGQPVIASNPELARVLAIAWDDLRHGRAPTLAEAFGPPRRTRKQAAAHPAG